MNIYTQISELKSFISEKKSRNKLISLVPTMGALHEGHVSLIEKAALENDLVVISIFVNPTQFNKAEDLQKYPRTFDDDIAFLKPFKSKVVVFTPSATDLYNGNIASKAYRFSGLEHEMEGKHRPGHFDGVGTVLNILFRIIEPHTSYFGEKDFQQLLIVKKLVEIEKLPVKIIGCPIYRSKNGLAMSSRNKRLTKEQLKEAPLIYKTLSKINKLFRAKSVSELNKIVAKIFEESTELELEYFEIANTKTLKTIQRKNKKNTYRAFIAVHAGTVRLIDNIALN